MKRRDYPVIVYRDSHQAVLHKKGEAILLESAPTWLMKDAGLPAEFPQRLTGGEKEEEHPLGFLYDLAEGLFEDGRPIRDYCVQIQPEEEEKPREILISGHVEEVEGEPPRAVLTLHDVSEIVRERRQAQAVGAYHGMVGQSIPMLEVFHKIATYGPTDAPAIITGETGTGKELVARALHERSPRAENAFVPVNCAALPPELFESELFGHEKGSFTGAVRQHRGRFERADGGTLFLDELGDMPLYTQSKLLRALEEGVIERVGSETPRRVDVRVIAATNIPIEIAVQRGRFRPDLYYRLAVFRIHLPPLRERTGDIEPIANRFLEAFNHRYNKQIQRFSPEALRILQEYHWPGNIRELRNVVERLVVETEGEAISSNTVRRWEREREYFMPGEWDLDHYYERRRPVITPSALPSGGEAPPESRPPGRWEPSQRAEQTNGPYQHPRALPYHEQAPPSQRPPQTLKMEMEQKPKELTEENIREAFEQTDGNATKAAELLGVHKATLYRHMKRLDLSREDLEPEEERT